MKMHFSGLQVHISEYLSRPHGVTFVISPFINNNVLKEVMEKSGSEKAIVITSWRGDHLRTGISSLETYDVCKANGWTLLVNDRLHMKLYSRDLDSAWSGSANLTRRGLTDDADSNHEVMSFEESLSSEARIRLMRLQSESTLVTDEVYEEYKQWLDGQDLIEVPESGPIVTVDPEKAFRTSQLPHSESPTRLWEVANSPDECPRYEQAAMEHDLGIYHADPSLPLEEFLEQIRSSFFSHPFIMAFTQQISEDGLHFGGVKQWIKRNCSDVPVPHAKEITSPTQILLEWIPALEPELFEVTRPNHSQVIRKL